MARFEKTLVVERPTLYCQWCRNWCIVDRTQILTQYTSTLRFRPWTCRDCRRYHPTAPPVSALGKLQDSAEFPYSFQGIGGLRRNKSGRPRA